MDGSLRVCNNELRVDSLNVLPLTCSNSFMVINIYRVYMISKKLYSCYILRCCDGSYYCGISNDVTRRVLVHNSGKGSKYVRSRLPATLVYEELCGSKSDALMREVEIKSMNKQQKIKLVDSYKIDGKK